MVVCPCSLKAFSTKDHVCEGYWRFTKLEQCKNPWKNTCKSGNIKLYILFKGSKLPICQQCWGNIADKDISW